VTETTARRTRTDDVYDRIRADIFAARLQPGQRLKFPDLCATYDTSVGVAREALTRLSYERLVKPQAHQGYTVTDLSVEELLDLTAARVELESLTFRKAIADGDEHWESGIVAALHLLTLRERQAQADGFHADDWYEAHEAFHAALLAGCGNRRLRETTHALRAEGELYRHWAATLGSHEERDLAGEHQALADTALAHNVELGSQLLRDHIARTAQILAAGALARDTVNP